MAGLGRRRCAGRQLWDRSCACGVQLAGLRRSWVRCGLVCCSAAVAAATLTPCASPPAQAGFRVERQAWPTSTTRAFASEARQRRFAALTCAGANARLTSRRTRSRRRRCATTKTTCVYRTSASATLPSSRTVRETAGQCGLPVLCAPATNCAAAAAAAECCADQLTTASRRSLTGCLRSRAPSPSAGASNIWTGCRSSERAASPSKRSPPRCCGRRRPLLMARPRFRTC